MADTAEDDWDEYEAPIPKAERLDFEKVTKDYHLISKIGEGTFSTVYKAEDRNQHLYDKSWLESRGGDPTASYYVAIKRIYATSSPMRIYNEIDILRSLSGSENVLPMITAFRRDDQVYIVLPYFRHLDFREYYRVLSIKEIRYYMRSLFLALEDVHAVGVIHRDVKPVNFLYDTKNRKGELVDFGLAERQQVPGNCPCQSRSGKTLEQMSGMIHPAHAKLRGVYLKDDQRPGKRANRAGTRGFRAPEVLFKCDSQSTAVDIWSAGVILLTFLAARFPFFNSNDDIEALIELTSIFGKSEMRRSAAQHNCSFESNIPTLHDRPISFSRLIQWSNGSQKEEHGAEDSEELKMAIEFMFQCLTLDPWSRWSAQEALQDEFLAGIEEVGILENESDDATDIDCETVGLQPAAEIDSPQLETIKEDKAIDDHAPTRVKIYEDTSSGSKQLAHGRPREFVFLKTDDYPDENLHNQMRQQLISNVNTMRAKREASLKKTSSHILPTRDVRPVSHNRTRSASAVFSLESTRPTTPLQQILPNTPNENELNAREGRAKSMSPGKSKYESLAPLEG